VKAAVRRPESADPQRCTTFDGWTDCEALGS